VGRPEDHRTRTSTDAHPNRGSPAAGSKPCRAEQLSGRLTGWRRPTHGGETPRRSDAAIGTLIGEVDVQNTSKLECTLQGETPTMLTGGREVPMLYAHGINEQAQARVIAVPAGGHASLHLDWSGPLCQPIDGPLELAIEVPHDGGTLRAPITADDRPGCQQGEAINPNARATLYASGFAEPVAVSTPAPSPLDQLTVTTAGPATAAAGSQVAFHVTLGNPTSCPFTLQPCPGYLNGALLPRRRDKRGGEHIPAVPVELPPAQGDPRQRRRVRDGHHSAGLDTRRARADRDMETLPTTTTSADSFKASISYACRNHHQYWLHWYTTV
jgi:hypothetical protein